MSTSELIYREFRKGICNLLPVIVIREYLTTVLVVALETTISHTTHRRASPALVWCMVPRVLGGRRLALCADAAAIQIVFSGLKLGGIGLIIV